MAQKIRVYKLAQEFSIDNESMVGKIQDMGIDITNYMSAVENDVAQQVRRQIQKEKAENTVEDRIRPTVIRRRQRGGAQAKPARVRPPKTEDEEIATVQFGNTGSQCALGARSGDGEAGVLTASGRKGTSLHDHPHRAAGDGKERTRLADSRRSGARLSCGGRPR